MHFRQSVLLLFLFIQTTTQGHCETPPPSNDFRSGYYIGIETGWSKMTDKAQGELLDLALIPFQEPSYRESYSKTHHGFVLDVLGGYRHFFKSRFMLGVDLSAAVSLHDIETPFALGFFDPQQLPGVKNLAVTIKRAWMAVPSLTAGWALKDFLIFGKLGIGLSKFTVSITDPNNNKIYSQNALEWAFVPTLGVEKSLNNHISLIATVSYEHYLKIKQQVDNITNNTLGGSFDQTTFTHRPSVIHAKVGLLYKF
jgi:opacity protein-like surface antigen